MHAIAAPGSGYEENILSQEELAGEVDDGGEKAVFLTLSSSVRPYDRDRLDEAFRDIASEMKAMPSPEKVATVAQASGTHLLKMLNKNVPLGAHLLRAAPSGSNDRGRFFPSVNAADSPVAKLLFRPIAITGVEGSRTLVDHVTTPDDLSPAVLAAFEKIFGIDCLKALAKALATDWSTVPSLHHENFPIIFLPGVDGDVQVTPIPPADAWFATKEVLGEYFRKVEKGEEFMAVRRGARRSFQEVSGKMQNISPALGGARMRFLSTFPEMLTTSQAGIWRYAHGGRLPIFHHPEIVDLARAYLRLHLTQVGSEGDNGYSNADIRRGMRNLARWLVSLARDFIAEVNEQAAEINRAFTPSDVDPVAVLLRRYWKNQKEGLAIRAAFEAPDFRRHLEDEA